MINNQWYAVLSSNEVKKGKIVGARRFGENLIFSGMRKVRSDASRACVHTGVRRLKKVV